jgi:fused signal recognition particle receptor
MHLNIFCPCDLKEGSLARLQGSRAQDWGAPSTAIFDAVEYAKAHNKDVVLADTAGRLHTNINLMDQMKKIVRVTKPDLFIFVDEATAGNYTVESTSLQ